MKKKILLLLLLIVAFNSYSDDRYDDAESFYGYSYHLPGDGGEGGGSCKLIKVKGDDIFDRDGKYPYEMNFINFFLQALLTKKIEYSSVTRLSVKYSLISSIYLSDIYLYITKDGKKYRAGDITNYYIGEGAVYIYYELTTVKSADGLLPFTIIDLEGFDVRTDDGEELLIKKEEIKFIRRMN